VEAQLQLELEETADHGMELNQLTEATLLCQVLYQLAAVVVEVIQLEVKQKMAVQELELLELEQKLLALVYQDKEIMEEVHTLHQD
jgi:hypothetical protein